MTHTLTHQIEHLEELLETAQNPKILWEEMQILGGQAFDLQDKIMLALDRAEETETDIAAVQQLFETREYVWDLMNQIALLEAHLKEKTFPNGQGEKKAACSCHEHKDGKKHSCHCAHNHKEASCHCAHEHKGEACCSTQTGRKKCTCQSKKTANQKACPTKSGAKKKTVKK